MPHDPFERQTIACRLVIIDGNTMQILTNGATASALLLREPIPAFTRVAQVLTGAIERRYGLFTIQLALLPGDREMGYCAIHELIGFLKIGAATVSSYDLDQIAPTELTGEERTLVHHIMQRNAMELGRFAQLGWIKDLLDKTVHLRDRTGPIVIQQLNQGVGFCLVSMTDATDRKIWFKAVGEPNAHEYELTLALSRRFPNYLPKILAVAPEWNGWVMEHVEGVPLNDSRSLDCCEEALSALATIQKESVNDIHSLRAIGAQDWSCARLRCLRASFFRDAGSAMEAQMETKSKPLSRNELFHLEEDIQAALDRVNDARIPDTLVHGDIGHGNVISTASGPVFLDWAEAYIGHPFLSAEYLLADLARSSPLLAEKQHALRLHYAAQWSDFLPSSDLQAVVAFAAAVSAFAYAVIVWDTNRDRPEPEQAWPLIRSMLRRTKKELELAAEAVR